ncbi:MAG TPA: hypothetical protein VEC37_05420, partial [Bacillota bacterium]|nr:hypothetical protein [Bacillota bacterium]
MKCKLFQITLLLLLFSTFACVFAKAPDGHFYDVKRNHLEPYDYLYNELTKFFGNKVPDRIVVKYTNEGTTSKFNVNDNSVLILESS